MNGSVVRADEAVCFKSVKVDSLDVGPVSAYVVPSLPLNVDLVLGLDVISEHGITVDKEGVRLAHPVIMFNHVMLMLSPLS